MSQSWEMSRLSRFTDMKCPIWNQPVFVDDGLWLYPFNYSGDDGYPLTNIVKLKFLNENQQYNKSLDIVAELTGTYGQWCNWEETIDNKY